MSSIGVTGSEGELLNPDNLTGLCYRDRTAEFTAKLKRHLIVQHWPFASALAEILPFALETVSPSDADMIMQIPSLNSPSDERRPKGQLSGGISIGVTRRMIVDDQTVLVPAITFMKYSHAVGNHPIKEVKVSEILGDLKKWTDSHQVKYKEPFDYADVIELALITFLEKGFQIYSGTGFRAADRQYYRIAFLRGDMFVEMIVTMDDLFIWGSISESERKRVMC